MANTGQPGSDRLLRLSFVFLAIVVASAMLAAALGTLALGQILACVLPTGSRESKFVLSGRSQTRQNAPESKEGNSAQ
jgi:hypothetical protein